MSIISKRTGGLLCETGDSNDVHTYGRVNLPVQHWYVTPAEYNGGSLDISAEREITVACNVPLLVYCVATERMTMIENESSRFIKGPEWRTVPTPTQYAWVIEDDGAGHVRIRLSDGRYLTAKNGTNKLYAAAKTDDALQLFEIQRKSADRYYVVNVATGMLVSESGEDNSVHLYSDCGVDAQVWEITEMKS